MYARNTQSEHSSVTNSSAGEGNQGRLVSILESINKFGDEPITRSNWRTRALVVGLIFSIPLVLVPLIKFINDSRPRAEEDLPLHRLSELEVVEAKIGVSVETEDVPRGDRVAKVVKKISSTWVFCTVKNRTDWEITSFTVHLAGMTAHGESFEYDMEFSKPISPFTRRFGNTATVSRQLEDTFIDFDDIDCQIIGARGTPPQ